MLNIVPVIPGLFKTPACSIVGAVYFLGRMCVPTRALKRNLANNLPKDFLVVC